MGEGLLQVHIHSQQEWHCLPESELTARDHCVPMLLGVIIMPLLTAVVLPQVYLHQRLPACVPAWCGEI
jgi:hypothetical protein